MRVEAYIDAKGVRRERVYFDHEPEPAVPEGEPQAVISRGDRSALVVFYSTTERDAWVERYQAGQR